MNAIHALTFSTLAQTYSFPPAKTAAAKHPYIEEFAGAFRVGFSAHPRKDALSKLLF
jgi:hypothetical protein